MSPLQDKSSQMIAQLTDSKDFLQNVFNRRRRLLNWVTALTVFLVLSSALHSSQTMSMSSIEEFLPDLRTPEFLVDSFTNIRSVQSIHKADTRLTDIYWHQVFDETEGDDDFKLEHVALLQQMCANIPRKKNLWVECKAIRGGLFNKLNVFKGCLQFSIATGANMILPKHVMRHDAKVTHLDQKATQENNFGLDYFWDTTAMQRRLELTCPGLSVALPEPKFDVEPVHVPLNWLKELNCRKHRGCFDAFRDVSAYVDHELAKHEIEYSSETPFGGVEYNSTTPIILDVTDPFLTFNYDNDPSGQALIAWTEMNMFFRFAGKQRAVVNKLYDTLAARGNVYLGVHLRAEGDASGLWWDDPETQVTANIEAAVSTWKRIRSETNEKLTLYLACGDFNQTSLFVSEARERDIDVVTKWSLADGDAELRREIDGLDFDLIAGVDYAMLLRSRFFFGQRGSSFSYTIANMRESGRYRGSGYHSSGTSHLFGSGTGGGEFECCL